MNTEASARQTRSLLQSRALMKLIYEAALAALVFESCFEAFIFYYEQYSLRGPELVKKFSAPCETKGLLPCSKIPITGTEE